MYTLERVDCMYSMCEILASNNNGNNSSCLFVIFWSKIVTHLLSPELLKRLLYCKLQINPQCKTEEELTVHYLVFVL